MSSSWQGRKVFLTGHTGFKGGWLALWLASKGATVRGYALDPATTPSLFAAARVGSLVGAVSPENDIRGDIRNPTTLDPALHDFAPDVVFHMAAQPLVRYSYEDPIGTYETNVLGTARVLDAIRRSPSVRAVVVVTTDKCYENIEQDVAYRETDPLGGYDPYSSSKACAELVSAAYRQSFFPTTHLTEHKVALATARAGNVIGGGDWSPDRLLPDLIRGFLAGTPVRIRRPQAIRPWQHVLEPLHGYIRLAEQLLTHNPQFATAYNFGPSKEDSQPVAYIADTMVRLWGPNVAWIDDSAANAPHEAHYLSLDTSRARADLNWRPRLRLQTTLDWLVQWYRAWHAGADMHALTLAQIADYESLL
ncbi:MAG: CDP-glucose 4,6-dehydratase [Acidobacteriaceae bacterium]|jgi:CDP-glucose 4,6-dehydratase